MTNTDDPSALAALPPILDEIEAIIPDVGLEPHPSAVDDDVSNQQQKPGDDGGEEEQSKSPPKKKRKASELSPSILASEGYNNRGSDGLYSSLPDSAWLKSFLAFHLFRSQKGPTAVPSSKSKNEDEKRLAAWVNSNRKLLNKVSLNKANDVTKVKVAALQQIPNFPFHKPYSDRVSQRLDELRAWKEEHGHLHVPTRSGPLGKWVTLQRSVVIVLFPSLSESFALSNECTNVQTYHLSHRVKYNQGKLEANIKAQLEEIGLVWSEWESRYEELKEYKRQHGDCVVPRREEFKRLNRWVTTQRQNYKVPGKLSEERIRMLDDIGFAWSVGPTSKPKANMQVYDSYHDLTYHY